MTHDVTVTNHSYEHGYKETRDTHEDGEIDIVLPLDRADVFVREILVPRPAKDRKQGREEGLTPNITC